MQYSHWATTRRWAPRLARGATLGPAGGRTGRAAGMQVAGPAGAGRQGASWRARGAQAAGAYERWATRCELPRVRRAGCRRVRPLPQERRWRSEHGHAGHERAGHKRAGHGCGSGAQQAPGSSERAGTAGAAGARAQLARGCNRHSGRAGVAGVQAQRAQRARCIRRRACGERSLGARASQGLCTWCTQPVFGPI